MCKSISKNNKAIYPIIYKLNSNPLQSINCYLYQHNNVLTLIDAGIDTSDFRAFFEQQLNNFGFELTDINQIILTHHHSDHIGLVNDIVKLIDIPVYAHYLAIPRLYMTEEYQLQKIAFFSKLYREYGCEELAAERIEKMKNTFENSHLYKLNVKITPLYDNYLLGDLQVLEMPGHSLDSIVLFDTEAKWLFAGDLILSHGSSNALIDHDSNGFLLPTVIQYRTSLEKCLKLEVQKVFSGHQSVFSNIEEVIENNFSKITYKLNRLVKKVEQGKESVTQIAFSIYGNRTHKEPVLILSEVIGYLYYAECLNLIKSSKRKDVIYFQV